MPDKDFNYELQKHLEKEIPELLLPSKPTLDEIICAFLEGFDVFIKPSTLAKRDRLGDAVTGGVLGAINPYAIAVDQGLKSQYRIEKNQKVTEWIQWKQWALAHPDFFDYKQNILLKFEDKIYEIRELANEPEMQERISEVKRKFIRNQKLRRKLYLLIVLIILTFVIVSTIKEMIS